jgi:VWFA-related protein
VRPQHLTPVRPTARVPSRLAGRQLLAALLCAGVALIAASPAGADVRIVNVDTSGLPSVRVTVVTSTPTPRAPLLTENGQQTADLQARNLGQAKSVVLAIDRSQSMYGRSLRDAAAAAVRFVALKPPADQIAVVTFASQTVVETQFSTSPDDAEAALGSIRVDGRYGTTLYDAVVQSAGALARAGLPGRVIVLVTDGQETTSNATLDQAIRAARRAHVLVYPIAIESSAFSPAPLRRLARETGGTYYGARGSSELGAIYENISRELRRTWQLQYLTAGRPGDTLRLRVTDPSLGAATKAVRLPGRPATAAQSGLPMFALGLALLLAVLLFSVIARPVLESLRGLGSRRARDDL